MKFSGHSLFNLEEDPFELINLNENKTLENLDSESEESKFYTKLLGEINVFVHR